MDKYIVRVQVIGEAFEFSVPTQYAAEKLVKEIQAKGYTHWEGNASRYFRGVVYVEWRKERG